MNHQIPGPIAYDPDTYNTDKASYPPWMKGSLIAEDRGDGTKAGSHIPWHVAVIEDIDGIDHDDSHTATANLLAAAYNAFDKAARELGVDATELARKVDLAAVLRQAGFV